MSETTDRERAARAEGRREGLREAAAIYCCHCAAGLPVRRDGRFNYIHEDEGGIPLFCRVVPIRRLLESEEGSDE